MAAGFFQRIWYNINGTSIDEAKVTIRQHDLTDCGAACLTSISAHYGLRLPIARIRPLASTDQKGTNILGLVEAAQKLGFSAKAVRGDPDAVFEVPRPAIAHAVLNNKLQHYVVVYRADRN